MERTVWNRVGALRRARRIAGLSQREMAERVGVAAGTVARAEDPDGGASLQLVEAILVTAGLRLAVVDADGAVVAPMRTDVARNSAGRYYPAHLDIQVPPGLTSRNDPWRWDRPKPSVTFLARDSEPLRSRSWAIPGLEVGERPDDHYTREELARQRELLEERHHRRAGPPAPESVPQTPEPECACGPECESTCDPSCECQCEPVHPVMPLIGAGTHVLAGSVDAQPG